MAVLIFEKSAEVTKRLIDLVKEAGTGIRVYQADSFTRAIGLLQEKKFEIIILDMSFGEDSSLELLQMIKMINRKTTVIMMYTHTDEDFIQQCKANGAEFLFDKYNDFEKIPAIISSITVN
jgi:DNA-binding NarL/FixJ family response regulator